MASRSVPRAIRAVLSTPYSVPGTPHARRLESSVPVPPFAKQPASRKPTDPFVLGPWRLTRRLRSGGRLRLMRAAVAGDRGPGCYVVKTPAHGDLIAAAMLRREATGAAGVNSPHLVAVVANQAETRTAYIVQPYLDGITLRQMTRWQADRGAGMSLRLALAVCRQIAAALSAMHAAGWLHGQVRPEHVIVSPRGHATLIDLTQAQRLNSAECVVDGSGCRWPGYASPESFVATKQLTAAADIYSLGVVLFEAIAGQLPFCGSPRELAVRHRAERPPELRRWRPDASKEVSEVVWRMLAKEPLRRPSAEQVSRWLAEIEIEELASSPSLTLRVGV